MPRVTSKFVDDVYKEITDLRAENAALKLVVENGNSLQQLKAEVAALVDEYDEAIKLDVNLKSYICGRIEVLRKLSAD